MKQRTIKAALGQIRKEIAEVAASIGRYKREMDSKSKSIREAENRWKELKEAEAALLPLSEKPLTSGGVRESTTTDLSEKMRRGKELKRKFIAEMERQLRAHPDKWFTAEQIRAAMETGHGESPTAYQTSQWLSPSQLKGVNWKMKKGGTTKYYKCGTIERRSGGEDGGQGEVSR